MLVTCMSFASLSWQVYIFRNIPVPFMWTQLHYKAVSGVLIVLSPQNLVEKDIPIPHRSATRNYIINEVDKESVCVCVCQYRLRTTINDTILTAIVRIEEGPEGQGHQKSCWCGNIVENPGHLVIPWHAVRSGAWQQTIQTEDITNPTWFLR